MIFISSVANMHMMELKDLLWRELQRETKHQVESIVHKPMDIKSLEWEEDFDKPVIVDEQGWEEDWEDVEIDWEEDAE